jgi:hypothetical protein
MENPVAITEDILLIRRAMAHAVELYREMTEETGAPTLGIQNQVVAFIRADPDLCLAASRWARTADCGGDGPPASAPVVRRRTSAHLLLSGNR